MQQRNCWRGQGDRSRGYGRCLSPEPKSRTPRPGRSRGRRPACQNCDTSSSATRRSPTTALMRWHPPNPVFARFAHSTSVELFSPTAPSMTCSRGRRVPWSSSDALTYPGPASTTGRSPPVGMPCPTPFPSCGGSPLPRHRWTTRGWLSSPEPRPSPARSCGIWTSLGHMPLGSSSGCFAATAAPFLLCSPSGCRGKLGPSKVWMLFATHRFCPSSAKWIWCTMACRMPLPSSGSGPGCGSHQQHPDRHILQQLTETGIMYPCQVGGCLSPLPTRHLT